MDCDAIVERKLGMPIYWKNSEIRVLVEREARPSETARLVKSKLEKGGYLESGPEKVWC